MVYLKRAGRGWKISGFALCNVERCRRKERTNLLFSPRDPNIFDMLESGACGYLQRRLWVTLKTEGQEQSLCLLPCSHSDGDKPLRSEKSAASIAFMYVGGSMVGCHVLGTRPPIKMVTILIHPYSRAEGENLALVNRGHPSAVALKPCSYE